MIATLTDEEVYEKFLNGDTDLIDIIYNRYKNDLINFSRFIVRNLENAEEIVQDIFIQILSNPNSYNKEYTVRSFLFLLCYRKSITYNTKLNRRRRIENEFLSVGNFETTDDVSDIVINYEEKEVVLKALQLLKLEYRIVLELTEFQGFSTREASMILNRSEGATKTLKCRAKESLKKIIDNNFEVETERKSYKRNTLKAIILIICIGIVSFNTVYAMAKAIKTIVKNIQYFNIDELDGNADFKDNYITEDEARNKIREYLNVLSYDLNDNIKLFKDVIKKDRVYWRYSDENIEIRIDAITGEFSKFYYKDFFEENISTNFVTAEDLNDIMEKLEMNINNKKVYREIKNSNFGNLNKNCMELNYYNNLEVIKIKYFPENNAVIYINFEKREINNGEILISYEDAIEILNSKYDVSEIIESDLIDVEVNYLVNCESTDISSENKVKNSGEYRISWNIVFKNNKNKKMSVFVDCETGEIIESKNKI